METRKKSQLPSVAQQEHCHHTQDLRKPHKALGVETNALLVKQTELIM